MRLAAVSTALLAPLLGCATDPSTLPLRTPDPHAPIDVQALVVEVARSRRLQLPHGVRVKAIPAWIMSERMLAAAPDHGTASDNEATAHAFGFVPEGTSLAGSARAALAEGTAGYYDSRLRTLFVRDAARDGALLVPQSPRDRIVLAHEIEHALQDENFGLLYGRNVGTDEALAYRALVEGDAQFTAAGIRASDIGDTAHWVSRVAFQISVNGAAEVDSPGRFADAAFRQAPPYVRRLLSFPYLEGTVFVAALYRARGLSLIDAAFAHPPRSTEQVLHPEKFVAGEDPVPVATPHPPDGWRIVQAGSLGELQTAALLAQCMPRGDADRAACGWGGDAWAVVSSPDDRRAILWSTVWDDEPSAIRFEEAAGARGECTRTLPLGDHVGREVVVVRDGKRVAFVQGLAEADREPAARALLTLSAEPPVAVPPFGPVTVPPLVDPDVAFAGQGSLDGAGVWTSEALGMRLVLPEGFRSLHDPAYEIATTHDKSQAFAGFHVVFAPPSPELEQRVAHAVLAGVRKTLGASGQVVTYRGDGTQHVRGGVAHVMNWNATLGARLQLAFVPACHGRATVVEQLAWGSYAGGEAIDRWLAALSLPDEDSPACLHLQRVHDD